MNYKEISEKEARNLIRDSKAGYWEACLRDSISPHPIPHPEQTAVFIQNKWYLIPKESFQIKQAQRVYQVDGDYHQCIVTVTDQVLSELITEEFHRRGRVIS